MRNSNFVKSNVSDMPSWAKGIIGIALLGGVAIISYIIYKKIKEEKNKANQKDVIKDVKKEEQQLAKTMNYTHPQSVYSSTANFIENQLAGCEVPNTELSVVKKVMTTVENKLDWAALVRAFDVRILDDCGPFGETKYTLSELLNEQLDSNAIGYIVTNGRGYKDEFKLGRQEKIADVLRRYLKSKGIEL
jgi:hypothetical protein